MEEINPTKIAFRFRLALPEYTLKIKKMKLILVSLLLFACFSQNGCKDPSCVSGDCANGEGTWLAKDGSKYVGQWKNRKMDGQGKYMYPDGTVYDGGWKNGKINGQGTWINPEGLKYEGEWKDDMMNGQGILIFPDGKVHKGEWHHGEFRGPLNVPSLSEDTSNEEDLTHEELKVQEALSLPNDKTYESQPGVEREILTYPINTDHAVIPGEGINNEKESIIPPGDPKNEDQTKAEPAYGRGIYTYPDGGKYEGDWKDGKRNGRGIYTYPDGGIYEGQWSDGKRNGQGTYLYPDGGKYKGEWKDDGASGQGIFSYSDGSVYVGKFRNSKRHGWGTLSSPEGIKYEGDWRDGEFIER